MVLLDLDYKPLETSLGSMCLYWTQEGVHNIKRNRLLNIKIFLLKKGTKKDFLKLECMISFSKGGD